jgi:hypothetical protein
MKPEGCESLDRTLECAVTASWEDLMPLAESGLIHIEYGFSTGGSIDYLKLWSSTIRGQWHLACEYWMSPSTFHSPGIHFETGHKSDVLARNLDLIMQHQKAFLAPVNLGRNGLLQIQQPTNQQRATATTSINDTFEHVLTEPEKCGVGVISSSPKPS